MTIWGLDTPTLLIDLGLMDRNLDRMAALARRNGVARRPHTKTHKIPALVRSQASLGAQGITVIKLGEAEVMAEAGLTDIFIANEITGLQMIIRLLEVTKKARVAAETSQIMGQIAPALRSVADCTRWISSSSTPTAPFYNAACGVTEIRPGTYIYNDRTTAARGKVQ